MTIEEKLKWVKPIRETVISIGVVVLGLLTGSWLIAKRDYDHATLSDHSMPLISPSLEVEAVNDWIDELGFCTIRGKYNLINRGKLPWILRDIKIEVYEYPQVKFSQIPNPMEIQGNEPKHFSRSFSNFVLNNDPLLTEVIAGQLIVGPAGPESIGELGSRQFEINFSLDLFPDDRSQFQTNAFTTKNTLLIKASGTGGRAEINRKWFDIFGWRATDREPFKPSKEYRFPLNAATSIVYTEQCPRQVEFIRD